MNSYSCGLGFVLLSSSLTKRVKLEENCDLEEKKALE